MYLKLFFLIVSISLFPRLLLAQTDTIITYFDQDWKKSSKENFTFYRKAYKDNKLWTVKDFYQSGVVQMSGTYKDKKLKKKQGVFSYFSEDSEKYMEVHYKKGKKNGEKIRYNKGGVIFSKERYKKGKRNGFSFWYHSSTNLASKELFSKGNLVSYVFYDIKGREIEGEYEYEIVPEFSGGNNKISRFIANNVEYPEIAIDNGVQGRVLIKFIVGKDGGISDVRTVSKTHRILNKEAERVIKMMPNWSPGRMHNLPVRFTYTVPVNFKLK